MTRKKHDDYPTEPAMLNRLLALKNGQLIKGTVLEPAAGSGQLAGQLWLARWRRDIGIIKDVITNDPHQDWCHYQMDATKQEFWQQLPWIDWVVTNFKSELLTPILKYSLGYSARGVACILRLNALEPTIKMPKNEPVKRGDLLMGYSDNLRYLMPFSAPRPKFQAGPGTDSVTTCWAVWDFGWSWKARGIESPFQFATGWLD